MSPPGKLTRAIAFHLLEQLHGLAGLSSTMITIKAGKLEDIPFSPLELAAEVRAEAACPDDAEVDLSTWSYAGETSKEARARAVLRKVAVKWWASYQKAHALKWLQSAPKESWNVDGIASCIWHIKACQYFKWMRGSRIFFWKIPTGEAYNRWLEEFRDGIECWKLPGKKLLQGRMPNIKTDIREDELLTREKILRLRLCAYLEAGLINLAIPRFTVPKAAAMMLGLFGIRRQTAIMLVFGRRVFYWETQGIWRKLC
jgi:hypothetical protein